MDAYGVQSEAELFTGCFMTIKNRVSDKESDGNPSIDAQTVSRPFQTCRCSTRSTPSTSVSRRFLRMLVKSSSNT